MIFGLTNAPVTFQRVADMILSQYKWKPCIIYLENVIVLSKTIKGHIRQVDEVLTTPGKSWITLQFKNATFSKQIKYLGHKIRPDPLEILDVRVKSMRDARITKTVTQLRSFLGAANVYRRFVPNNPKLQPLCIIV